MFNFPEKMGKTYPTRMEIPDWYYVQGLNLVRKLTVVHSPVQVKRVGEFSTEGLTFLNVKSMDFNDVLEWAKNVCPIDYPDVAEWMQWATAAEEILLDRQDEYISAGSFFDKCVDDAYIPGVSIGNIYIKKQMGEEVTKNGYSVVVTPQGNFQCPVPGKVTIVTQSILAWAAEIRAFLEQHVAALMKWVDLAINPKNPIGFVNISGLVAPQFIGHQASRRAIRNVVELSITSNKQQNIKITYRSPSNYGVVYTTISKQIPEGQSVLSFKIYSLFGVPPMVVEFQPENGTQTILNYYEVKP